MAGKKSYPYINREISWLSFNERVLQEAEDKSVPLIERLRFLGIYSNNRDEFFRVRIATLRRTLKLGSKAIKIIGEDPEGLFDNIQAVILRQQKRFSACYNNIIKDLEKHNIHLLNELQLIPEQQKFVRQYFKDTVFPRLVPIMLDSAPSFPYLRDKSIYLLIRFQKTNAKKAKMALVEIPSSVVSRFVLLPEGSDKTKKMIMLLDDAIRFCLGEIFSIFEYDKIEAYSFKITRDAELDIDLDVSKSQVEKISRSLKNRKHGEPVRMAYDAAMPAELLQYLMRKLKLKKEDNLIAEGRYLNFKDFMDFPDAGPAALRYKHITPLPHPLLQGQASLFKVIRERDIMLTYPYQSYHHIIDLLREASIDPKVEHIKISLYRVAKISSIVNALINAIKNGKQVTAVIELQARFDEEANIYWSNKLQEEGATIIYGVPGLKVHSKLFLIERREKSKLMCYAHIGTGNFNEDTSRVYSDHAVLTADKRITDEAQQLFHFYSNNFKTGHYKHLIVSPFDMRKKLNELIAREIQLAKKGKPAWIFLKMNSLVDRELIDQLYKASDAGVKIKLIVRGICSLVTKVPQSKNIEAISIVDKYLEHSRVFIFGNHEKPKFFLSSADFMVRNLDHRSEVAIPIYDASIQKTLMDFMNIQWSDNVKARVLNQIQDNQYRQLPGQKLIRSQDEIYKYFQKK